MPESARARPKSTPLPTVFPSLRPARSTAPLPARTASGRLRLIPASEIFKLASQPLPQRQAPAPPIEEPAALSAEPIPASVEEEPFQEEATAETATHVEPEFESASPASSEPFVAKNVLPRPQSFRTSTSPSLSQLSVGKRSPLGGGFWVLLFLLVIAIVVLLYFFGFTPRLAAKQELDREQKLNAQRIVVYGVARLAKPEVELPLPGTIEAFQQASLHARTNGYVKKWLVDIGDKVQEGQVLAELDTPEIDQQLTQAQAAAEQAKAAVTIAKSAADRWDAMAKAHAVSQEDADQKDAANTQAEAGLKAADAGVARLVELENFKQIRAPFSGKVTYRNVDVGSLVSAGPGAANSELFRVAQTDPVRVYLEVPEANAPAIKAGLQAKIEVPSYPGRVFHGEVVRDAGALNVATRTLRTELRVANPDGALLPGAFADVHLQLASGAPAVLIPSNALIVNGAGTSVALVMDNNGRDVVHYTPVRVGRDFGTEVEVLENVKEGDRLVTNPPADLNDGAGITARPMEKPPVFQPLPPHPSPPRA